MTTTYVTTSIPYVNARPHLGHALEFVQADILARHARLRGEQVRLHSGTDDNAVKNVAAARQAGLSTAHFVDANATAFADLVGALGCSVDSFIRTSRDRHHRDGVQRLWRTSAAKGDFYRRSYTGRYCTGCEQFYNADELLDGSCPEHLRPVETVTEENWFFRLSRYAADVERAIASGRVAVLPEERRNEVLAWLRAGVADISVSRPYARSGGWGIPVPGGATDRPGSGEPAQVIYVWWDALANYLTALYEPGAYQTWWADSDRRIHVVGKGIIRFHTVHWLALLLSAGLPLPTAVYVHEYLTADGVKISKSSGTAADPTAVLATHGVDAVRWWLASDVARLGDTDFTVERLERRYAQDLAGGFGNLAQRLTTLLSRYRGGLVDPSLADSGEPLLHTVRALPGQLDRALARFELRAGCTALTAAVTEANRYLERHRPWELARAAPTSPEGSTFDRVLATALVAARGLAVELSPVIPAGAARLAAQLGTGEHIPTPAPVFPALQPHVSLN